MGPVVLRIKLRYDDVESMVQRFAPNVGKSGLFLPTKSLQAVGAEIKFELRLASDQPVLLGLGRVKVVKEPDPLNPKASFGMAVELMRVTRESRDLILRMLERRKQLGLPEVAIPLPGDIDAARRADFVDTNVKRESGPIPTPIAVPEPSQPEQLLTSPRRASGPIAVVKQAEIAPLAPEAPRKKRPAIHEVIEAASGPIAAVSITPELDIDVDIAAVLARARMLAGGDLDAELEALREVAAAPIEISIEAASAELARQLGGAAVRRDARGSAPTAWAPPPATQQSWSPPAGLPLAPAIESKLVDAKAEPVEPDPAEAKAEPVEAKAEPVEVKAEPIVEKAADPVVEEPEPAEPEPAAPEPVPEPAIAAPEPVDTVAESGLDELRTPVTPVDVITTPGMEPRPDLLAGDDEEEPSHEVDPEQIHDEIHQLSENDFEEVEHTQAGLDLDPSAFEHHAFVTTPAVQHELAERLDRQLAEAEAEAEGDDLGIAEASGVHRKPILPPAEIYDGDDDAVDEPDEPDDAAAFDDNVAMRMPSEYQQDFVHHFGDRSPEGEPEPVAFATQPSIYGDGAPYQTEPAAYDAAHAQGNETIDAYGQTMDASMLGDAQPHAEPVPDDPDANVDEIEEIDDFEILAEADEEDADLLTSHGEQEASSRIELPHFQPEEEPAPRVSDFAMRLDLGDDDEPSAGVPDRMDLEASAGHALAGFSDEPGDEEEPSHSYTFAEHAPAPADPMEFDEPHSGFSPPNRFDQSDVAPIGPQDHVPMMTPTVNESYVLKGPVPKIDWSEESNEWRRAVPPGTPSAEHDLESALQALDVDLDDIGAAHAPTELPREAPKRRAPSVQIPRPRAPRASTDDGVLIDFDDDDD